MMVQHLNGRLSQASVPRGACSQGKSKQENCGPVPLLAVTARRSGRCWIEVAWNRESISIRHDYLPFALQRERTGQTGQSYNPVGEQTFTGVPMMRCPVRFVEEKPPVIEPFGR
jgi:hypothetical protein